MSRKKKHAHVNHERWMVSYADFVTLLFAFFVVMFASSRQDHKKAQMAQTSIRTAFRTMGAFPELAKLPSSGQVVRVAPTVVATRAGYGPVKDLNRLKRRMEQVLAPQIADGTVTVTIGREGLLISLLDAGFFETGSAIPKTSSIPVLNRIGRAIAAAPYDVRIEGHTDNVPIHNALYASNWELSTARATVLTRLFIEKDRVAPDRLSAAGYAQYHPVASNRTAAGRSKNRRVDIIVLPSQENTAMKNLAVSGGKPTPSIPEKNARQPQQLQAILAASSRPATVQPPQPATAAAPLPAKKAKIPSAAVKQGVFGTRFDRFKRVVQGLTSKIK